MRLYSFLSANNMANTTALRPGVVPISSAGRASQIVTTIIPAGKSIPILVAGSEFYLTLATAPVLIRPNTGAESQYTQGTGSREEQNPFSQLQVTNQTASNIVISIFVGFGNYIDNRVILYDPLVKQAVVAVAPIPNVTATIHIPDLSGQAITDINGVSYLALGRVGIYISNLDLASSYSLTDALGVVGAAIVVQPQTNIVFPVSGDYRMHLPSSNLNAVVSDVYNAVLPTLQ